MSGPQKKTTPKAKVPCTIATRNSERVAVRLNPEHGTAASASASSTPANVLEEGELNFNESMSSSVTTTPGLTTSTSIPLSAQPSIPTRRSGGQF